MLKLIRFSGILLVGGVLAWACSGENATTSSTTTGGSSGTATTGGTAGDVSQGGAGGSASTTGSGGSAGSSSTTSSTTGGTGGGGGTTAGSGGSGIAGSSSGAGGTTGMDGGSLSPLGCSKDADCIVAYAHSSKGCCARGCGSAFNKDYVAADPCVTADEKADPVPASCDTGCLQCPGSLCQQVFGAVCQMGQCTSVTQYGPCTVDDDCVMAIDYQSLQGGCCSCAEITNKQVLAHDHCVVPKGQPKPADCAPTGTVCNSLGCPNVCPTYTKLTCSKGMCMGS